MKKILLISSLIFFNSYNAQSSCSEIIDLAKANGRSQTFFSPSSEAISQVTFYDVNIDYNTLHFAIVKFTSNYYKEYIYQVGSNTKMNYSMNYITSAGKSFWKFIEPYNQNLKCAPNFD
ncbi:hypothetical protein [Epilithonimonas vandammei]|uniref:hypothetical protein n=1 Tax=Epilithonimonas vandammei TaxID=2487072 RepID=UPI0028A82BEC|nr:hypothetical protein [Epilithonimonas vandammei]